jgi:hypothetical protein
VNQRHSIRRGVRLAAATLALAAVPIIGGAGVAGAADSGTTGARGQGRPAHAPLTDAQKQCLADQGVTVPEKPADGSRPQLSQEQRDARKAAAQACGLPARGPRGGRPALTDAQKQCLADQGVTVPEKPADGSRPQRSQEQKDAMKAAAQACGLPARGPRGGHGPNATA